ncbi:hypothetical protein AAFC00_006273 [Neodothiora populina]
MLVHLSRILDKSSGTDSLLQVTQYTLMVLYTQLERVRDKRMHKFFLALIYRASKTLLSGETVIATLPSPTSRLDSIITGSKKLSGMISDFRTFTRLWGLLGIYTWAKATWNKPPADGVIRTTVWIQVLAGVGFQWYENLAYLADKGVLHGEKFNSRTRARWWEISSRYWMAHCLLEVVRLLRQLQLDNKTATAAAATTSDEAVANTTRSAASVDAWRRAFVVNAAWTPMTVHYSWEQGCIDDKWIGILGLIASWTGFRQLWKST